MILFGQQLLNGVLIGAIYALIALGFTLIFGILRVVNFAHGELYMLGAFVAYTLIAKVGMPYLLAGPVAAVVVALLTVPLLTATVGFLRQKDETATVLATIGLSMVLQQCALLIWGGDPVMIPTPFGETVTLGPLYTTGQRLLTLAVAVALIVGLTWFIRSTNLGRGIRAVAQDADAAALVGVSPSRIHVVTHALAGGLAASAGVLIGPVLAIHSAMGEMAIFKAFVVVILGGLGSVPGAIAGGFALGVVESLGAGFIAGDYKDAFGYVVLIAILLLRPAGLFGKVAV